MKSELRKLKINKSQQKLEALSRWEQGEAIAQIARSLGCTRDTIYRWVARAEKDLSKNSSRRRTLLDQRSHWIVIEAYILLGAPSVALLQSVLTQVYSLKLSIPQIRHFLKVNKLNQFIPSSLGETLIRWRLDEGLSRGSRLKKIQSARKWLERS
jgi:transposase